MNQKESNLCKESLKTRKAREKLRKQLESCDKQLTSQALQQKSTEINRWIARHAQNRVTLKHKGISLFDENEHTAEPSSRVQKFAENLKPSKE